MTTLRSLARALAASLAIALLASYPARAQQVDLHGTYIAGQDERQPLSGFGIGLRQMFTIPYAYLGARVGLDYAREHGLGPGRSAASLDLMLTPGLEDLLFLPYVGGSISANRSGGQQAAWSGTRAGFDALVGAILPISVVGLQLEGRYGYIEHLPHVFTARVGFVVDF